MSSILVVEDETAIAELIALNLRHAGFEVTLAAHRFTHRPIPAARCSRAR